MEVNSATGEPQNASGWSQDDPAKADNFADRFPSNSGAAALKPQSPMADNAELGKTEAQMWEAQKPYREDLKKALDSPQEATAHLQKVKAAPKPEDYQKYSMEFASAMAVIGAISGRWTRHAGNASLNAFAGALNGWKEGNLQAYESAAKEWDQNTKKTLENNKVELEQYREIIENNKLNIDQKMDAIQIVGLESQNSVITDLVKKGDYNGVFRAIDKMNIAHQKLQSVYGTGDGYRKDQHENLAEKVDYLNENPSIAQNMPPAKLAEIGAAAKAAGLPRQLNPPPQKQGTSPAGQAFSAFMQQHPDATPEQQQAFIRAGRSSRSGPAMAVQQFITEGEQAGTPRSSEDINKFMAHYGATQGATRAFAFGPQGNAIRSFNVAIDHLATMDELITALNTKDVKTINAMQNRLSVEFGQGAVPSFEFAKEVVGDEITKAILGSNIGAQADREALKKQFDAALSPQALRSVIATAKKLMAGQLSGFRRQYTQSTGGSEDGFNALLSPDAQKELGGLIKGAAPAGDSGGATSDPLGIR